MEKNEENQELDADILASIDAELTALDEKKSRKDRLNDIITDRIIKGREDSGYWEATALNARIDRLRKSDPGGYKHSRRRKAEAKAAKEGRTLREYQPATPDRRKAQQRASKANARLNPDYAEAEKVANTAARAAKREAMTEEERAEANRIRREKRAAKKPVL